MIRVYQFFKEEAAKSALSDRRLKISRLDNLNDPFECLAVELRSPGNRSTLNRFKCDLGRQHGLLCFSRTWHNPLLWAHYADKHRGLCLGFDIPLERIRNVDYVNSRLPWPSEPLTDDFVKDLLFCKSDHWSYEDEYRSWTELTHPDGKDYFAPFSKTLKLREVIVGAESDITRSDVDRLLGSEYAKVKRFKARTAFTTFDVVENKKRGMWS